MTPKVIGHRQFTDGVTRPVYEDERGQFILEDGERIDGVWLVPEGTGPIRPPLWNWEGSDHGIGFSRVDLLDFVAAVRPLAQTNPDVAFGAQECLESGRETAPV